jgi:hypothetical protein
VTADAISSAGRVPVDQPDGAEPDGAEPDGAEPDGAEPDGEGPDVEHAAAPVNAALPDHLRPVDHTPFHTDELPALPTRDRRMPASAWIEAPARARTLGLDLGHELVTYKRRIGDWYLWRAGPASGADARYLALHVADLGRQHEFRLFPDGAGEGSGPDGVPRTRFRAWKESLLAASGRPVRRRPDDSADRIDPGAGPQR